MACRPTPLPAALAALGLLAAAAPARADLAVEVDVELVIAVDVSRSMTPRELEIQRRGYAEALASPEVAEAIRRGVLGRVAMIYVEWAGARAQRIVVGWTLIETPADAIAFAAQVTSEFDPAMRRTSISGALDFALGLFEDNGFEGLRRVIDVSGDGPNNDGRPVLEAREAVLDRGITINGLPLMTREGAGSQWHLEDLDEYYRHCVIGGPMAFLLPVHDWEEFPVAVRRKLVLDIAGLPGGSEHPGPGAARLVPAAAPAAEPYDCLVGEKIWERNRRYWQEP